MSKLTPDSSVPNCSFCNKGQEEVKKMIAGPEAYICNECVELCNEILSEDFKEDLGIDEVTFHKNTPLTTDRSKVRSLMSRGARLSTEELKFEIWTSGWHGSISLVEAVFLKFAAFCFVDCTKKSNIRF